MFGGDPQPLVGRRAERLAMWAVKTRLATAFAGIRTMPHDTAGSALRRCCCGATGRACATHRARHPSCGDPRPPASSSTTAPATAPTGNSPNASPGTSRRSCASTCGGAGARPDEPTIDPQRASGDRQEFAPYSLTSNCRRAAGRAPDPQHLLVRTLVLLSGETSLTISDQIPVTPSFRHSLLGGVRAVPRLPRRAPPDRLHDG